MLFLLLTALNVFLLVTQFNQNRLSKVSDDKQKTRTLEFLMAGHLLACAASLFLQIMWMTVPALIVAAAPVAIAGVSYVIYPLISDAFRGNTSKVFLK